VVGAVVLLEPVGATALAAVILDEWPGLQEIAGAIGIIAGVGWLSRRPSPE
jgi:drug/metabolite transporter (DMT)-like permease